MSAATSRRPRWGRRFLLFLLGAAAWTLISSYPNPGILLQNLARYRRLPIDPMVEKRMDWELPRHAATIEAFVDSLIVPTPDWPIYRVPWYVPTALEAARSRQGDCEAKAILLASLLAGKKLPFEVRASLNHIWVDYPGRPTRAGESRSLAYLEGEPGRLRIHWPRQVKWGELLAIQRQQLWDAMPLARKAIWLIGLVWVALGAALSGGAKLEQRYVSDWRLRWLPYLARSGWVGLGVLAAIVVTPALRRAGPTQWAMADVYEVAALSALSGAFAAWVFGPHGRLAASVADDGRSLTIVSARGPWLHTRTLDAESISHLVLDVPLGGGQPWTISATRRDGGAVAVVRYGGELSARAALRELGLALKRPIVVRCGGVEYHTMPDEIPLSLRDRAARREPPAPLSEQPRGCDLEISAEDGRWSAGYPAAERQMWKSLVGLAVFPVLLAAIATAFLMAAPQVTFLWIGWVLATSLLSLTAYLAIVLQRELLARLSGVRLEVGDGALTLRTAQGRVDSMPLARIESVEIVPGWDAPSLAIISQDRIMHIRGLCDPSHLPWLREAVARAIASTPIPAEDSSAHSAPGEARTSPSTRPPEGP